LLEEMCLRLSLEADGLRYAAQANQLSQDLRLHLEPLPANATTALALAAGIQPAQTQWDRLHPALYTLWRQLLFAPEDDGDGSSEFLLFHVLAARDGRVLDDINIRSARNGMDVSLQELVRLHQEGRVGLFVADDTARRLLLAIGQLSRNSRVHAGANGLAQRLSWMDSNTSADYSTAISTLDSLQLVVDNAGNRAAWRGSAQSLHEPVDLPLEVANKSIQQLRHRFGARLLTNQGMHWVADLDPEELVPGQQVATWWHISSTRLHNFHAWRGAVLGQPVSFPSAPAVILPDTTILLRSSFATLDRGHAGTMTLLEPTIRFALEGFGEVEISDPLAARIVAPIQASLDVLDGAVIGRDVKRVAITVTSRSPAILDGTFQLLQSADWTVSPATSFTYQLRRPGQTVRQTLEIQLPTYASPGPYRLNVRLVAAGQEQGTLRTTLIKPIEWVVIGPFAPPPSGSLLAPERGVNFDRWYTGDAGTSVSWQLAALSAYDVDGALDFDSLYEGRTSEQCACAFTVIEAMENETIQFDVQGAEHVQWNGIRLQPEAPVALQTGRNTLLLRACSQNGLWRLRLQLTNRHGETLHTIDNDLSRMLDGFEAIKTAPRTASTTAQRLVTVQFNAPEAREVAVLGAFNAWVPIELDKREDGSWRRELLLAPGRYPYKLLVDGQLKPDPAAVRFEPDGFGGRNSLLIVK
jgi:hypothetical protein